MGRRMKIALIAPLTRPPHPDTRGSRPRIVYDLANYLVNKGHEVTTFAAGDSIIPGKLIPVVDKSIYLQTPSENVFYQHTIALAALAMEVSKRSDEFDIIHNHSYPEYLPLLKEDVIKTPIITTPHLYLWPELIDLYRKYFNKSYFVPIAKYQKKSGRGMNWLDVVHNGIAVDEFEFNDKPKDYFLFFGRIKTYIGPDGHEIDPKGVLDAIKVCKMAGEKLYIAGNVEDRKFFDIKIKPELNDQIKFIGKIDSSGPIGFKEKIDLYKNAKGYFFLSHWDEGAPLGPMESMACGTPVIANRRSSLPEIVIDNETGFIVEENDFQATVEAVKNIGNIDRKKCRKHIEDNFSVEKMGHGYEKAYEYIINKKII
jgi:glycosyltransferase involved in cell wall biosynthesis